LPPPAASPKVAISIHTVSPLIMILTVNPWPHQNTYTPLHPSPLSTRSANACSSVFANPIMTERREVKKELPFSKRAIKSNPIIQSRDAVKERRRNLFLRKVQDDRDDRRWASRGDQVDNPRVNSRVFEILLKRGYRYYD
jgi:hypothetical protein